MSNNFSRFSSFGGDATQAYFVPKVVASLVILSCCWTFALALGAPAVTGLISGIVGGLVGGLFAGCPCR